MREILQQEQRTIGTTPIELAPDSDGRVEIIITNTSSGGQNISLAFGQQAEAGKGVFLTPYSGYNSPPAPFVSQQKISVVSSAAGGTVAVFVRRMVR